MAAFRVLIDRLFGNWKRRFAFFSILVGIISPIISFYIQQYPTAVSNFITIRDIGFLVVLVGIIMFLSFENFQKDYKYEKIKLKLANKTEQHAEKLRNRHAQISSQLGYANYMIQRTTQELFQHYQSIFLGKVEIKAKEDEYEVFKKICLSVTSHVRDSIKSYLETLNIDIGNDISVSVKLILPPKNIRELYPKHFAKDIEKADRKDLWIITAYRDNVTWEANKVKGNREITDSLYTIEGNTAFRDICKGEKPKDRFVSNDLMDLQSKGHYENETLDWHLMYNSTLVVPIVLQGSVRALKEECRYLGFLTVDSLNPHSKKLYDNDECYHILNHAALLLSQYFLVLILYHDN